MDLEAALRRLRFRPVYPTDWQRAHGNRWYVSNTWKDPDNNVLEIYSLIGRG